MNRFVQIMLNKVPFPPAVGTFFVSRFPEELRFLVTNAAIEPSAFNDIDVAKCKAEVASDLLSLDNPQLISTWCASRDKPTDDD